MALGPRGQAIHIGHMQDGPQGREIKESKAQCPICGTMGRIQDGLYDTVLGVVKEAAQVFRSLTPDEATALAEVLTKRRQEQIDDDAVVAASPPEARDLIKKTLRKPDYKFWLGIVLWVISVLLAVQGIVAADSSTQSIEAFVSKSDRTIREQIATLNRKEEHLKQVVEEVLSCLDREGYNEQHKGKQAAAKPKPTMPQPPSRVPNRNEKCWCGSGRRFNRCHGIN
jgi:hypothetical protein